MTDPGTKRRTWWCRPVVALITVLTGAAGVSVPLMLTGTAQAADSNTLVVAVDMLLGGKCDDGATMRINLNGPTPTRVSRQCGYEYVDVDVTVPHSLGLGVCEDEEDGDFGLPFDIQLATGVYMVGSTGAYEPMLQDFASASVCARPGEFVPMDMGTLTGSFLVRYALR